MLSHCHHCICAATASTYKVPHRLLTSGTGCVEQAQCMTCVLHTIDLKAIHKARLYRHATQSASSEVPMLEAAYRLYMTGSSAGSIM